MKARILAVLALAAATVVAIQPAARAATSGSISGTVRGNGEPLAGAYVSVIGIVDNGFFGRGPADVGDAVTDANGNYTVDGLAPSGLSGYWVCFSAADLDTYQGQCYDHVDGWFPFPSGAGFLEPAQGSSIVTVGAGQHRTNIDADLHPPLGTGGGIAGKVTRLGVVPMRTVKVTAYRSGSAVEATYTSGAGKYVLTALAPGAYAVCFDDSESVGAGRHAVTKCRAAAVTVTAGAVKGGVNASF